MLNQSKEQVSRNGKRPRVAYREVLADVVQHYGEETEAIGDAPSPYKRSRTSLYRAYNHKFPTIPSFADLPNHPQFHVSMGRVPWILANNVTDQILILVTPDDLSLLHGSNYWVADGNFDYRPPGFAPGFMPQCTF